MYWSTCSSIKKPLSPYQDVVEWNKRVPYSYPSEEHSIHDDTLPRYSELSFTTQNDEPREKEKVLMSAEFVEWIELSPYVNPTKELRARSFAYNQQDIRTYGPSRQVEISSQYSDATVTLEVEDKRKKRKGPSFCKFLLFMLLIFAIIVYLDSYSKTRPRESFQAKWQKLINTARTDLSDFEAALKIAKGNELFQKMSFEEKLARVEWIPNSDKFEGVQNMVNIFKHNGTNVEKFLYLSQPHFTRENGKIEMDFKSEYLKESTPMIIANCEILSECYKVEKSIVDNFLYLNETFISKPHDFRITRAFYVSNDELIRLAK